MVAKSKVGWIIFALLIIPILVCGQGHKNNRLMNSNNDNPNIRMFNPQTIQAVQVVVQELKYSVPEQGITVGLHLLTNLNDKLLEVHLGPVWFVNEKAMDITEGDSLEIVGSMITYENEEVLIAKTIQKKGETLILRNDDGKPLWAGWMKGKGRINK